LYDPQPYRELYSPVSVDVANIRSTHLDYLAACFVDCPFHRANKIQQYVLLSKIRYKNLSRKDGVRLRESV